MKALLAVPVLGSLLIFQSAVVSNFPLLHGTADLVLIAIVAWAIQKNVDSVWQWGIIGGLMIGFVSEIPLVVPLVSYLLAVGLAVALRQRVWQIPILAVLVATFFGTLAVNLATFTALRIGGTPLPLFESLNLIVLPSLFLNLLLSVPFYIILGDLAKWLYPEELEM
jgi:hypothetical protein